MSLLIQHLRLIPAPAWPLSIGLVLNSAILFGNLGASLTGAVPIAREQLGVSGLKKKEKVRIWALFYKKAAFYIVPSILTSTALHLLSAYLTPSPRIRNFSLTAAASALSIIPYTLLVIMPTNKALLAMDEKNELTPAEESDVPYLLGKWNSLHGGRYLSYVVSWVAGLGGLMGVVGGW